MRHVFVVLVLGIGIGAAEAQPGPASNITVADRAAFYEQIASEESPAALAKLAAEVGALQRWQIEAIVERVFELEPAAAVRLAGDLRRSGGPDFTTQLYERLAVVDTNAALVALSQLDDPAEASIAAMATFRGLGRDERAFELVAASLNPTAAERFRADAIPQLAQQSPARAFAEALALTDVQARRTAAMIAIDRWTTVAPSDALAAVDALRDPELQAPLRATVLRNWQDLETLAAYLAGLDVTERRAAFASGALDRIARADPARAAQLVTDLPPGDERRRLLWQVGTSYAQRDPAAALAWARSLGAQDPDLAVHIVRGVALRDPLRAFDLAASLDEPTRAQAYFAAVNGPFADERQFSTLASRVVAMPDGQTKTALLVSLVGSWAARPGNMEPALQWMLANGAALPPESFERIAYLYAQTDPNAAAAYVDRVPQSTRAAWLTAVTAAYGNRGTEAAAAFLERYRGDPAFDRAAVMLSQQIAATDPPRAAQLLASVGTRGADGASAEFAIARSWASRDPAAAAAWAIELPLPTRAMATTIVASTWAMQNPTAVGDWALRLPPGEKRDNALAAALRVRGAAPPDATLLNAFSDDRARQAAVMSTIMATAASDVTAARRVIDAHISDPRLKAQAQQLVDGIERGAVPLPAGGVGFPAGFIGSATGVSLGGPGMPPGLVVAPTGQTIMVRPPEPGLVPLPPGVFPPGYRQSQGPPIPPSPPAPQ